MTHPDPLTGDAAGAPSQIAGALATAVGDRYRVDRVLGVGGMATVYLATDVKHDRPVALKVLSPDAAHAFGVERFQREVRLAARMQHPHILSVFDSGEAAGHLWYTMPFVDGESLRDRLRRETRLPMRDALRIAAQAAQALAYAHAHGVIHRDVKPENLLLTHDGNTLVADFGIARPALAVDDRLTTTGLGIGTPMYMSPEQAIGDRALDARTDVYSLGAVLYEMLAGEPPYSGPTAQAIVARQIGGEVPEVRRLRPEVSEPLADVVRRSLAADPSQRLASAADLAAALEAEEVTPHRTPVRPASARRPARYASVRRAAVALAAVAVVALGWWVVRSRAITPAAEANRLAVLPFAVHGGPGAAYLREGLVDLLSRNLDGAGDLRSVDGTSVLTVARNERLGVMDVESGRRLARRLGAALFVLGSVTQAGSEVRIDAGLYDGTPTKPQVLSKAEARGDTAQLFSLLDRVASELAAGRSTGAGARLVQTAAVTTQSLPALKAYLDGERTLRLARFDSAVSGFQRAVQFDSGFALAWYRLAEAAAARDDISSPQVAAGSANAMRHASRLSPRDQRLVRAFAAMVDGRPDDAEREYRALLSDYPDDVEAQWRLAELLKTYNPPRGRPIEEALPFYENVRASDPAFHCTFCSMRLLLLHAGRLAEVESLVARKRPVFGDMVMFAAARGDRAELARLRAQALDTARTSSRALVVASFLAGQWVQRPDLAEPFALAGVARPDHTNSSYITLVKVWIGQGRWAAADSLLAERALGGNGPWARTSRALNATWPFLEVPRAELAARRAEVAELLERPQPGNLNGISEAQGRLLRIYTLGLLSSRMGDTTAAYGAAARLADSTATVLNPRIGRSLGAAIRADAALGAGRPAEVLQLLGAARGDIPLDVTGTNPFSEDYARFLRVEALLALGRDDEALRWLTNGFEFAESEMILRPWIARRLAQIHERRGDRRRAADEYARFARLWGGCDPALRPLVDDARARLARLRAEAS